ncbi:MBL fold metallo-hydrolase [Candidatus Beckwithbacteria bacterium]|nr:MBL fold metallo-hydrolase [Candidatus Beckwithbacteria bacterium]
MKSLYNLILVNILILIAIFNVYKQYPDQKLRFIQCDVGQGDAVLITKGFTQILIDSGEDNQVLSCLQKHMPFWDKKINLVIATHPDKDHIGGFDEIATIYSIALFVDNGADLDKEESINLSKLLVDQHILIKHVQDLDQVKINGIEVDFIWPKNKDENKSLAIYGLNNDNEASIVTKIKYQQFSALVTGDIPLEVENELVKINEDLESLVLKVAHHGSKYSSSQMFLQMVNPQIATIGVGKNSYGHPDKEIVEFLKNLGTKVYRTDEVGDVVLVWDNDKVALE